MRRTSAPGDPRRDRSAAPCAAATVSLHSGCSASLMAPECFREAPATVPPFFSSRYADAARRIARAAAAFVLAATACAAQAQAVPGTMISNQATVSGEQGGFTINAASNTVRATVGAPAGAVFGAMLQVGTTVDARPGQVVDIAHTLTNIGSGTDRFTLAFGDGASQGWGFDAITLLPDADGDGRADGMVPLAMPVTLAPGGVLHFVIRLVVPAGAASGTLDNVSISATSVGGSRAGPMVDTVRIASLGPPDCGRAWKVLSRDSGPSPAGPVKVTITYDACDQPRARLVLVDRLPPGMRYVPGSGRWSGTGDAALTDAVEGRDRQGAGPGSVAYDFGVTTAGAVTATIHDLPREGRGWVSFEVDVEPGLRVGTVIPNQATYTIYDASDRYVHEASTDPATYRVTGRLAFELSGERLPTAVPGSTLTFTNVLVNHGDLADRYDITLGASTFPEGTTFTLFQADGVTPLADSDASGVPDTGPVPPGGTSRIVLVVRIPETTPPAAYQVTKHARSAAAPMLTDSGDDVVDTVASRCVATFEPDNQSQVGFGQHVTYTHWLTNRGNCTEVLRVDPGYLADDRTGWSSRAVVDGRAAGGGALPGALDPRDPPIEAGWTATLAPGESLRILVDVLAPTEEALTAARRKALTDRNVTTLTIQAASTGALTVRDTTSLDDKNEPGQPVDVIRNFTDDRYVAPTHWAPVGGSLWLRADAPSCNAASDVAESRTVVLTGPGGERETLTATETAPGSGVFLVPAVPARAPPVVPNDGIVQGRANDSFEIEIVGCARRIATVVTLMEPVSVVFDSATNEPVAGAEVSLVGASGGRCDARPLALGAGVPNPVVTGADGRFAFPPLAAGDYCLAVRPPNGYRFASQVPWPLLPQGRNLHVSADTRGGSYGDPFALGAGGLVVVDLPVDPAAQDGLFVQKAVSRAVAEVGEFVDYSVRVRNATGNALDRADVTLTDDLPAGFTYVPGSARRDGSPLADPSGGIGPRLAFNAGRLGRGEEALVTYRVRIGAGAMQGDGINRARATYRFNGATTVSNTAVAKVQVTGGVFSDKGFILGKVFLDCNANGTQEPGEAGVPGVRLLLQDGTLVFTDGGGKFSFYGISNRTQVVKADPTTLPRGARLAPISARHLGDGGSRIVDLKAGELHRADFAVAGCEPAVVEEVKARTAALTRRADEIAIAGAQLATEARPTTDIRTLPASGVLAAAPQGVPAANALPQEGAVAEAAAVAMRPPPRPSPKEEGALLSAGGASVPLEQLVPALDNTLAFIDLTDGDTLGGPRAMLRVKGQAGAELELHVNGERVSDDRVGKRAELPEKQVQAREYFGVPLVPGENTLTLVQRDPFGNERGRTSLRVRSAGAMARLVVEVPAEAVADGRSPQRIVVRLEDAAGLPAAARMPVTLEASRGAWESEDLDANEPGLQAMVEGGRGEFVLLAPVDPGESRIVVTSGKVVAEARLAFLPELRSLVAAGLVEGVINLRRLDARALVPARQGDGFEQELRHLSRASGDGRRDAGARAAFFLKGKIRGEYLLTAAYDSEKDTRERLFRDIQPDEFYPVYGDSAIRGFDAQSTSRLYVRVDHRRSYLLYGDFNTQGDANVRRLSGYSRSLTGLRHHYENGRFNANFFASRDTTRQRIDEIRANGTSGPYELSSPAGLVNSEKVEILTRDRDRPSLVIRSVPQARFYDYEVEPLTGRILFKAPVPSVDQDLNPVSIRVTYEIDQGGPEFWVFGGDAEVKVGEQVVVGGSFAEDRNPLDPFKLRGAHAVVRLGSGTAVMAEFARTERPDTLGQGDAGRIHLRHDGERLKAEAFVARTDATFDNPGAYLGQGRGEAGARLGYQVDDKTTLRAEALRTEDTKNDNVRDGFMVSVERAFDERLKVELGVRHAREEGGPAIPASVAGPGSTGTTPREVTSVRARVTAPVPGVDDATVFGELEVDTQDVDRKVAAVGGEYLLPRRGRIYARHEFISSLTGPYGLNEQQRQNSTILGVDTEYMKDARIFSEYRIRDALSGGDAEAAIGLRNLWTLGEGWRLGTTLERVESLSGTGQNENSAVALALEYVGSRLWKGSTRIELRDATTAQSLLHTVGFAARLTDDWTFLGRNTLSIQKNKGGPQDGTERVLDRLQAGVAWRDADSDKVNALARIEHREERDDTQPGIRLRRTVELFSLHADWKPVRPFLVTGRYAAKWARDSSNGLTSRYHAHLLSGRMTWEFAPRWDIGLAASGLIGQGGARQYALGLEIGYLVATNLWVSAGYNFTGFRDDDLAAGEYTQRGAYVRVRYKFDESLLQPAGEGVR